MRSKDVTQKQDTDLRTYKQLFKALSTALYHDEDRKRYHGFTTALVGKNIAKKTGLAQPARIFYTGLIHDLGGLGLPHHVVHYELADRNVSKNYPPKELRQVVHHGPIGADMLSEHEGFGWASNTIRNHHERYDGTGFPAGKSGDELSIEVDILGAADMLDMYLCSLEAEDEPCSEEERVKGFEEFLEVHGGFREVIKEEVVELNRREEFIRSLLSIQSLEELVDEAIATLTPPGGINLTSIVELLGAVIDVKSNYTEDHSSRVATLGEKLGKQLGMSEKELRDYRYAAYLHDLGKVGIDRSILDKPSSLTDEEYNKIKKHPRYSEETLSEIEELEEVAKITGQHHERFDGTGYPNGLEGEDIELSARIISLVDAWDAMTSDRPYQKAMDKEEAVKELLENAGTQFDPPVVEEFLELVQEG